MSSLIVPDSAKRAEPKQDAVPDFDNLSEEEQAALTAKAEQNAPAGHEVALAYLVVVDRDGGVNVVPDLSLQFIPDRQPSPEDLIGNAAFIQSSIAAQITAQVTQQTMMAAAQAMAQQQQQAQMMASVAGKNLRAP